MPKTKETESLVVTPAEYAAIMKTAKSTVYKAIKEGRLPAMWVGRSVRIPSWVLNPLRGPRA